MPKRHVFLHIGPDAVEIDAEVRDRLKAVGILTPAVSEDDLVRADLEIRRAHKAAGLKRKEVEGAWATVCRRTFRNRCDTFVSVPGFSGADTDQAALALDGLSGMKVHLVVTHRPGAELPEAWTRRVKPERIHTVDPDLSAHGFADEIVRLALAQEKARLDKALLKLRKRRKQVKDQLAA